MPRATPGSADLLYRDDPLSAAEHADALVLVTEWPEFAGLNLKQLAERMNNAVLIDGRNLSIPEGARGRDSSTQGSGEPCAQSNSSGSQVSRRNYRGAGGLNKSREWVM